MKRIYNLLLIAAAAAIISCADSESRIPAAGTAHVVIDLGLSADRQEEDETFAENALRLFAREALAAGAPAIFSSVIVRVTAPDLGVIEETFTASGPVSMSVPAGSLRTFEVIATAAPYDPDIALTWTAAESYRGVARANLPAGSTVSVPVLMKIDASKIIVPDYYMNRLVVLDDMRGAPYYLSYADYSGDLVAITQPRDVDFDARGRIYFVYQYGLSRCDDLSGSGGQSLFYSTSLVALAVDRDRALLYFTDGSTVFRRNLDGSLPTSLPDTVNTGGTVYGILGMDVAADGDVLVTGYEIMSYTNGVFRLDGGASAAGVVSSFTGEPYIAGMVPDILVRGAFIYLLNPYPPNQPYSMKLLQLAAGPGNGFTLVSDGPLPSNGSFSNAGHFSSLRNDGLVIMDKTFGIPDSTILFLRDARGSGWTEYSDESLQFYDYAQGG